MELALLALLDAAPVAVVGLVVAVGVVVAVRIAVLVWVSTAVWVRVCVAVRVVVWAVVWLSVRVWVSVSVCAGDSERVGGTRVVACSAGWLDAAEVAAPERAGWPDRVSDLDGLTLPDLPHDERTVAAASKATSAACRPSRRSERRLRHRSDCSDSIGNRPRAGGMITT